MPVDESNDPDAPRSTVPDLFTFEVTHYVPELLAEPTKTYIFAHDYEVLATAPTLVMDFRRLVLTDTLTPGHPYMQRQQVAMITDVIKIEMVPQGVTSVN